MKNKGTAIVTLSAGVVIALVALALALDLGGIASLVPTAGKAVWGFAGCAVALIVCGVAAFAHRTTPQELVEQSDERNQAIGNMAARRAFTLFSVLVPIVALVLFVLDQASLVAVLALVGIEVVTFVVYLAAIARLQKNDVGTSSLDGCGARRPCGHRPFAQPRPSHTCRMGT